MRMTLRMCYLTLCILLSFPGGSLAASPNNIVRNGDFEIFNDSGPDFFPPWQFSHGFTGTIGNAFRSASGVNCVYIGGDFSTIGHMWQDLNTEVGQAYEFSFYERGDQSGLSLRTTLLDVYFGDLLIGGYARDNVGRGWYFHTFTVIAVSSVTRIDFQNVSFDGDFPASRPGVDGVSVIVVPEPSVPALLGLGSLALVMVRRKPPLSTQR